MATDIKKIIENLLGFYDFTNQTIVSVGAGGGQFIEYGHRSMHVFAIDSDQEALVRLETNLKKLELTDKFTLIHADFHGVDTKGDVVLFEFCLHEMNEPEEAVRHALTLAPTTLIADHALDSEWAYIVDETEKVAASWDAVKRFNVKRRVQHNTVQFFHNYDELFQKVSVQGERSIDRISRYKGQKDFSIPMSYSFALI